ncbi:Cell division septum initiation DivIVA, interacts with FtsZ, MinD [Geodermatophilus saharensis]|uniref:Cell division septum initiation DivIVA, interacts with FtsZ, MinD n=1 Tax=Geodermatophilus saharensis TaxID=1137994 RepID=A0A239HLC3_9ACTN|nr:DivIVA domain-containing protein [Geodermatophilus saharensis]SNS82140.1 Cell division septum initiation DivIVA, interacts with FtsZ, MinD [Geodermatophilus saharensis]
MSQVGDGHARHAAAGDDDTRRAPSGLDGLLGTGPVFKTAVRGYDRAQVDTYVDWAETEVMVLRRENDHLLSRYAACSTELQNARRRLAALVRERQSLPGPEEARALVARAEQEAAAVTATAEEEARRLLAEARTEAEARLRGVAEMREAVIALREQTRSEAAAVLEAARRQAAEVGRAAAEERARLDRAAAEARERLDQEAVEVRARLDREAAEVRARADAEALERRLAAEAELAPLRDERDQAREWLLGLTGQIDRALAVVAGVLPDDVPVLAERREAAEAAAGAPDDREPVVPGDASQLTVLHGAGRPEVAAAS